MGQNRTHLSQALVNITTPQRYRRLAGIIGATFSLKPNFEWSDLVSLSYGILTL
ncbi:hypothetical protein QWY93_04105 [Echinicola jeungdonensis]|uniref:Uncharacterized protein n=1 Tax=Echinicola jeungdonensis TaxID=709343 RepID=A0ABV5J2Y6_9BACT|nr:hypothetical protein [Echinicola jeungdonensis]MDN3668509.1 hypothetical protein [Echinicola jeungdonensis]